MPTHHSVPGMPVHLPSHPSGTCFLALLQDLDKDREGQGMLSKWELQREQDFRGPTISSTKAWLLVSSLPMEDSRPRTSRPSLFSKELEIQNCYEISRFLSTSNPLRLLKSTSQDSRQQPQPRRVNVSLPGYLISSSRMAPAPPPQAEGR